MKEIKFEPSACRPRQVPGESGVMIEVPPSLKGHVVLIAPSFDQRFEYIEQAGFELNLKGEVEASMRQMPAVRRMVKLVRPHFKAVELEACDDGTKFQSVDDLEMDARADGVLIEIAMQFLHGFKPSKN
jgi:hypothetical protein